LLKRQHYRLAWWRTANDEINWRRFFDINDLAALRMENQEVFETVHATLFRLYSEGLFDGVRVDHVDGLSHPGEYCRTLRTRLSQLSPTRENPYIVVEKILGQDEELPTSWRVDGTTGYDFMDLVSALLHDPTGERVLGTLWERVSGRSPEFDTEEKQCRRQLIERSFTAQLEFTVRAFHDLARQHSATGDFTRAAIRRVLVELLVHFRVYRMYARAGECSRQDRVVLSEALDGAGRDCLPGDHTVLDWLGRCLAGESMDPRSDELQSIALTRFQQLSAPLSAKAVEDTAFYRYGRLISRNDVGFDPRRFTCSPAEFHRRTEARWHTFPQGMLATATHDHKRGEDVRARLAVLSEIADDWAASVERWIAASLPLRPTLDGTPAPAPGDCAMLFQTIVGAWPPQLTPGDRAGLSDYGERIAVWQEKAMREAKLASDWSAPNEPYEAAGRNFVLELFSGNCRLLDDIFAFAHRIGPAGAVNALSQTLLKLTSPGVPDFYQGAEYWDLSLVDPDNRRPVDFQKRQRTLSVKELVDLAREWVDGRIKQSLIERVLAFRRRLPRLFAEGDYLPTQTEGPLAGKLLSFARVLDDCATMTLVPKTVFHLLSGDGSLTISASMWNDTHLLIPSNLRSGPWFNAFTGESISTFAETLNVARICAPLPFALLGRYPHERSR
jgi:(1->4)-alpha-D-glucan 1-alpha-D-glucosylmutase